MAVRVQEQLVNVLFLPSDGRLMYMLSQRSVSIREVKMLTKNVLNIPKVWYKFSKTTTNGKKLKLRWEKLSDHRYEEFIDFTMNYFVKYEITHIVAGIHNNPEAMEEYKQIITKMYKFPSYYIDICCLDDESNELIAYSSLNMFRRDEEYTNFIKAQTTEVKKFYHILYEWNNLCPVPELLKKYDIDKYMDDMGAAIHPKYRGCRITPEVFLLRHLVCKANEVPLTGAWMTAIGTRKSSERDGWETIYEISYEKLEKKLGVTFQNPLPTFQYKIRRID